MALFQWIATKQSGQELGSLQHSLENLGLIVDQEFCNQSRIDARENDAACSCMNSRVTVMIFANRGTGQGYQVEVRSSEPMLKRGTRCESIAKELMTIIPPQ